MNANGWIRTCTVLSITTLCIYTSAMAQNRQYADRDQSVVTAERMDYLDQRLRNVEDIKPAAILVRIQALEERVNDQQKWLWGIMAAVIINLLTGSPLRRRQQHEGDME